jgi:hypothetical protein
MKRIGKLFRKLTRSRTSYADWLQHNPGGTFKGYYTKMVSSGLDAGKAHASLGGKLKGGQAFEAAGLGNFNLLMEQGLRPDHVCVDYGCGTLRVGLHVIRYLEPDCYWGFDISDRFLQKGLELVGEELVAAKHPRLRVISTESVGEAARCRPDFIFSFGVMQHVHPDDFEEYFGNIDRLMQPESRCVLRFKAAASLTPCSDRSWAHSAAGVADALRRRGMREAVLTELPHRLSAELGIEITARTILVTRA